MVCSRYGHYINKKYSRTGTLWEGRHKASAVDSEQYLLKCYRYIELNPVAANMVGRPEEYVWSSYHFNAWGDFNPLVSPHDCYLNLDSTQYHRCYAYLELFREALSPEDIHAIRRAAYYSIPLGSDHFVEQIEKKIGRKVGHSQRGRPLKN